MNERRQRLLPVSDMDGSTICLDIRKRREGITAEPVVIDSVKKSIICVNYYRVPVLTSGSYSRIEQSL